MRRTRDESWQFLQSLGLAGDGAPPPLPTGVPSPFDSEGISFFRTAVEEVDLSRLMLARSFFGRSLIKKVRFSGSDLSQSNLCWNDFEAVVFDDCDLSRADLRASTFAGCSFRGANLRGADLRNAELAGCDFTDADLTGAAVLARHRGQLTFSAAQAASVEWSRDYDEPAGG